LCGAVRAAQFVSHCGHDLILIGVPDIWQRSGFASAVFPRRDVSSIGVVGGCAVSGGMAVSRTHHYEVAVTWTGDTGNGYRNYERSHDVGAAGKPVIPGSADPAFRGSPQRWNPEELLVASLAQCHMLWFLSLCATEGVAVAEYADHPAGTMVENDDGGGRFTEVVLRPRVRIGDPR
jgi:organic hydroperoxide reductase OsmC/OhrA